MTAALATGSRRPYGAIELKQNYQRGLIWALLGAVFLHVAIIGGVGWLQQSDSEAPDLIPPVSPPVRPREAPLEVERIVWEAEPGLEIVPPANVEAGYPHPVPDAVLEREVTIPTRQQVLEKILTDHNTRGGGGDSTAGGNGPFGGVLEPGLIMSEKGSLITVSQLPVQLTRNTPVYPRLAEATGIEGSVTVTFVIGEDGLVHDVIILKVSPPDMGFEEAVVAAVSEWTFKPAIQDGHYVAVQMNQRIVFRLEE